MKIAHWGWPIYIATLAMGAGSARAQSQQSSQNTSQAAPKTQSVVEAARRTKEEKKNLPKPVRVWNNDNLPKEGINVIGTTGQPSAPSAADALTDAEEAPQNAPQTQSSINDLKQKIAALSKDVDLAQRKYSLDSEMYYGKTDYQDDTTGKAALDSESADLEAKKEQLAQQQAALDSLQARLASGKATDDKSNSPQ